MITFDQSILDCQDTTQDYTATGLAFFKRRLNQGYKKVLAEFGTQQNERTVTGTTVASQQYYEVPFDLIAPKSATITLGSTAYPVPFVESQEQWDNLNVTTNVSQDVPMYAFYRPRFGVNGGEIGIFPTPSGGGSTLTLVYVATDRDLSQTAYVTGTVSVTNGSTSVTGTTTAWTPSMVGRYFQVTDSGGNTDGQYYRIARVVSATSITLEQNYAGSTASALTYQVCEMFALPEDMQVIPEYYALWHYYMVKQNDKKLSEYKTIFEQELEIGKETWNRKVRTNKVRNVSFGRFFSSSYPINFPSAGISS